MCVCACINICGYLCASVYTATRPYVRSLMFACVFCRCVHASVCVCVRAAEEPNFTATSTSKRLLCIPPRCPSTGLSCHYSLSIHREVIVGKKPIRWAGQRIIEVMIGAVQRQLIVMETGGAGEISRLTELSGGSGSARPECGITCSIDTAALVVKKKP